jgi:hypothetical protein
MYNIATTPAIKHESPIIHMIIAFVYGQPALAPAFTITQSTDLVENERQYPTREVLDGDSSLDPIL